MQGFGGFGGFAGFGRFGRFGRFGTCGRCGNRTVLRIGDLTRESEIQMVIGVVFDEYVECCRCDHMDCDRNGGNGWTGKDTTESRTREHTGTDPSRVTWFVAGLTTEEKGDAVCLVEKASEDDEVDGADEDKASETTACRERRTW